MIRPANAGLDEIENRLRRAIDRVWPKRGGRFIAIERIGPEWRVSLGEALDEQEAVDAGLLDEGAPVRDAQPHLALAVARMRMATGQALSVEQAELVQKALREGTGRPRPVPPNYGRDRVIVDLVELAKELGLKRTRNPAFRNSDDGPDSACSMVARLLRSRGTYLSEDAIEKIVKRHRRLLR